jgi:hypothetical protein
MTPLRRNLIWIIPMLKAAFAWDVVTLSQELVSKDIPRAFGSLQAAKRTFWLAHPPKDNKKP